MAVYEFTNPSDPYTFEAPDLEVAAVVTFLVGGGRCGADAVDGSEGVPIFLFGGAEAWVQSHFGRDLEPWFEVTMAQRREEVATALESFLYGNNTDREWWAKASPEAREAYSESRRSSMDNIGRRAFCMAAQLRARPAA